MILAIDPGSEQSGVVGYDIVSGHTHHPSVASNEDLLRWIRDWSSYWTHLIIEYPHVRGQMMKSQVIETIFWIGRFAEAWGDMDTFIRFDKSEINLRLCGRRAVKKGSTRRALIERFPATGGGSEPAIGTKKAPGPLYYIKGSTDHKWDALALAVAYADRLEEVKRRDDIFSK